MKIITLDEVLSEIGSQSRCHFQNLKRAELIEFFNQNNEQMREFIASSWSSLVESSPYLAVENGEYRFAFRKREQDFNWIENYDLAHFRNSVITNILFGPNQGEIKDRLDKIIYLNYYYRFMKREEKIDDLTQNTCFELQEIIKVIIDKELTLYRNQPTVQAIDAVRWRLTSERLSLLANRPSTVNFRKRL